MLNEKLFLFTGYFIAKPSSLNTSSNSSQEKPLNGFGGIIKVQYKRLCLVFMSTLFMSLFETTDFSI